MIVLQSEYVTRLVLSSIFELDDSNTSTYLYKVYKDNLVLININNEKFTVDNLEEKFVNGELYKYRIYYKDNDMYCSFECSSSKELKDKLEFYKRSYV